MKNIKQEAFESQLRANITKAMKDKNLLPWPTSLKVGANGNYIAGIIKGEYTPSVYFTMKLVDLLGATIIPKSI